MNKTLPGLANAILTMQFYSPSDYEKTFHLNSAVSKRIPHDFQLPRYDKENDMYYVGNAINADGEQHAEGAIVSAKNTVDEIVNRENILDQKTSSINYNH
jgi:hypothetical protein